MEYKQIAKIGHGQDGAIWNGYLFRFNHKGEVWVYRMEDILAAKVEECPVYAEFLLDRAEEIAPHCNAVVFGTEYAEEGDEFPLLYANIYNNYAKSENPLKGVCLVYRLQREGDRFFTTFVQMIEIGFVEDTNLWRSEEKEDVRPYGNFVIDTERNLLYAFNMMDRNKITRYFAFDLPKLSDGVLNETYGVKKVVLEEKDIKVSFDCPYHNFIQGACCYKGKVYSVEGFQPGTEIEPGMRVVDMLTQKQVEYVHFPSFGLDNEPEWIDFYDDVCYYIDGFGGVFILSV